MKNRFYMLFVLSSLISVLPVSSFAQRSHYGGQGGRVRSSSFPMATPHIYAPRVMMPGNYYHHYSSPIYSRHVYYGYPWYRRGYYSYYPFFPPVGFYVATLPPGYFSLGATFGPIYYYGGTYYEPINDHEGYRVVDAPMGAAVPVLPDGAQEVQINGDTYYELNGTYYQETMTDNGRRYIVVGTNGKIGNKKANMSNEDNNANNHIPEN